MEMELWEFNCCVQAYNKKQKKLAREQLTISWQTAALTGAAFAGKLKRISYYLKDEKKQMAPAISKDEFEEKLKKYKERRA